MTVQSHALLISQTAPGTGALKLKKQMKNLYYFIILSAIIGSCFGSVSAQDPCTNVALNKAVTASESTSVEIPSRAVDGNLTTQWCAPDFTGWIKIDLQNKFTVNNLKLYVNQAIPGNTVHEIKVSSDMVNWTLVKTISDNTTEHQVLDVIFNPALSDVQGVMINTTESNSWVAWYEIQVFSGPTKPTISQNGAELTSSATSNNQWYFNGNPISEATSQTYSAIATGSYQVGVSSEDGCISMSDIYTVTTTGGINIISDKDIKIYPNPAKDNIVIEGVSKAKIELFNLQGQFIKNVNATGNKTSMDISDVNNGVYSIKITTTDGIIVKKISKQ